MIDENSTCKCGCGKSRSQVISWLMYEHPAYFSQDQAEEIWDGMQSNDRN